MPDLAPLPTHTALRYVQPLREGGSLDENLLASVFKHLDYSEYGGAPLLGVRGISIISHGKSSDRALKNAIKVAARAAASRLDAHIGRYLGERSEGAGSAA